MAFPGRRDAVDRKTAFLVGSRDKGQQRRDAEIVTVGECEADQQDAEQEPPNQA